jgi:hypothetical protein
VAAAAQVELHSQGKPGAAIGRPRSEDWQKQIHPFSHSPSHSLLAAGTLFRLDAEWDGREFRGPGVAAAAQMVLHSQGKPGAALGRPRSEDWQKKFHPPSHSLSHSLLAAGTKSPIKQKRPKIRKNPRSRVLVAP